MSMHDVDYSLKDLGSTLHERWNLLEVQQLATIRFFRSVNAIHIIIHTHLAKLTFQYAVTERHLKVGNEMEKNHVLSVHGICKEMLKKVKNP